MSMSRSMSVCPSGWALRRRPRGSNRMTVRLVTSLAFASLFPVSSWALSVLPQRAYVTDETSPMLSITAIMSEAAQRYGIPESWIGAVMRVESAGNPRAVSPKGAMGLMQLMPATWARMSARYGLGSDPFDMRANIHAGAAYLREMFDRYHDLPTVLAAYNAGPGRADDWLWRGRPLPAETRAYVARITPASGTSDHAPLAAVPAAVPPVPPSSWRASNLFSTGFRATSSRADDDVATSIAAPSEGVRPAVHHRTSMVATPGRSALFVPVLGQSAP